MKFKKLGFKSLAIIFTALASLIMTMSLFVFIKPFSNTSKTTEETVEEPYVKDNPNYSLNYATWNGAQTSLTVNYTVHQTVSASETAYIVANPMINGQVSGDGKYYVQAFSPNELSRAPSASRNAVLSAHTVSSVDATCTTKNYVTCISTSGYTSGFKMGTYQLAIVQVNSSTNEVLYDALGNTLTVSKATPTNIMTVSQVSSVYNGVSFSYTLDETNLFLNTLEFAVTSSTPTSSDWKSVNETDKADKTINTSDYGVTLEPSTNYTIYFKVNGYQQVLTGATFQTPKRNASVSSSNVKANSNKNTKTTIEYNFISDSSGATTTTTYNLYQGTSNSGTLISSNVETPSTETNSGTYEVPLTGLSPGTSYYIEFLINGVVQTNSGLTWTTTAVPEDGVVTDIAISDVGNTNATVSYTYTGSTMGGSDNVTFKLYEGTSSTGTLVSTQSTSVIEKAGEVNTYSWDFQNLLKLNTNYYLELYVGATLQGSTSFKTTNNKDGVVSSITATGKSNTSAEISFSYASATGTGSNAVTYTVYQGTNNTGTAVTNLTNKSYTATSGTNTFTISSNLAANTNYYIEFKVNGVIQGGATFSTQNNFDGVITNITATGATNTSVNIAFTYQVATGTGSNAVTYTVYKGTSSAGTAVTNLTNKTYTAVNGANSFTISSNLTANTNYYIEFKVNGTVQGGESFTTTNNFDGKATSITATPQSNTTAKVTYTYTAATGTGSNSLTYSVYTGTNNTGTIIYNNISQTPTVGSNEFTITGLTVNTQYYVEIKVNGVVQGGATFKTQNNVDGKVTAITATGTSNTSATFTYNYTMATGTGSNTTTYTIYQGTSNSGTAVTNQTNKSITPTSGSNTFSVTTDLLINTQYYIEFKVNGVIQGGATFTTQNNVDGKITNVTASGASNTSANISFTYASATGSGSNAVTYTVYKGSNNTGTAVANLTNISYTATAGSNSFTINSHLTINTQYYIEFKVNGVVQGGAAFTTQNNVDAKVTSISATGTSNTTANVTYTYTAPLGSGSSAVTYTVYQGTNNTGTAVAGQTNVSVSSTVGSNTKSITGLIINTNYYIEFKVNGVIQGGANFTTLNNNDATVTSSQALSITDSSVSIRYQYNAATGTGSKNVTYSLYQGTSTAPGNLIISEQTTSNESTSGFYSQTINNLAANTTYIVQFSVNGVIQNSSTISFTTTSVGSTDATITNPTLYSVGRQTATINYYFTPATGTGYSNVYFVLYEGNTTSNPPVQQGLTPANEFNKQIYQLNLANLKANTDYILLFYVNGEIQEGAAISFQTQV